MLKLTYLGQIIAKQDQINRNMLAAGGRKIATLGIEKYGINHKNSVIADRPRDVLMSWSQLENGFEARIILILCRLPA